MFRHMDMYMAMDIDKSILEWPNRIEAQLVDIGMDRMDIHELFPLLVFHFLVLECLLLLALHLLNNYNQSQIILDC